jgi:hypothetical protein
MQRRQSISPMDRKRRSRQKGACTLRRAVRSHAFAKIPGGRHMECAYYYLVDGTWNVPTTTLWTAHGMCLPTLIFVGCVYVRCCLK